MKIKNILNEAVGKLTTSDKNLFQKLEKLSKEYNKLADPNLFYKMPFEIDGQE